MSNNPRFAIVERDARIERVPEWRVERLLKTSRFQQFLKNNSDWLTSEGCQNLGQRPLMKSDILPERIREVDANVRDGCEFQDRMEAARKDTTGNTAWKYYEDYKRRPKAVYIEGESAAEQFLCLAKELKCKSAEMEWLKIAGIDGAEREDLERSLIEGGVPNANISHVMFFFCRVKNCKIDIHNCKFEWCLNASMVTYLAQGEPRFWSGRDWMGYPAQRGALFSAGLLIPDKPDESSYEIWDKFRTSSIEDLTEGEIVWLTAFFTVANKYVSLIRPWSPEDVNQVRTIGKVLREKMIVASV